MDNAVEQALRFLSFREHNEAELSLKLRKKGYTESSVNAAIEKLRSEGALSEERYIRAFVRSNNKRHPEGKEILLMRLVAKDTKREIAQKVLDDIYTIEYVNELTDSAVARFKKKGIEEGSPEMKFALYKVGLKAVIL